MEKKRKMTADEAMLLAKEKYPERYETIYVGEGLEEQRIDVNTLNRAAYVRYLTKDDSDV